MGAVGLVASITIVIDVSFDNKVEILKVLKLLSSRFTSAVPSDSNSIRTFREVATATAPSVATQSSILLHNTDRHGIVQCAIDTKAALLLTTCARYECNEKTDEGK